MKRALVVLTIIITFISLSIPCSADAEENSKVGMKFNYMKQRDDGSLLISVTIYNRTDYETDRFWLLQPWTGISQIRIRRKIFFFGDVVEKPLKPHTKRTIKFKIPKKALKGCYFSKTDIENYQYKIWWFVEVGNAFYWGSDSSYSEDLVESSET